MQTEAGIRWIAFDAVGTLITADPPVADVYHRIGCRYGSQLTVPEVGRRFRNAFRRRGETDDLASSESIERDFWRAVVRDALPDVTDAEACFAELHAWFAQPSAWRCFEDVGPTLQTLAARGYRLAIASNFDERLHSVRSGLPALKYIDACVISTESGWRKPHPGFFRRLAEVCECPPAQILMVGDDIEGDIYGAEQAGFRGVLLERSRTADSVANRAQRAQTVGSLRELEVIVAAHTANGG